MQKLLRLCLWQAIIIGILTAHFPVISAEEERGIRMRGPKSSDVFPYDRYGPITSKDTLWNIATRVKPDTRLSVYQVMQALYQKNPQAFVDSNINHLIEGQYLKIPSFNNMMAINTESAKKKSARDSKAWLKIQPKATNKIVAQEPTINKKDLETVKTEIKEQLQKIDGQQQKRLENIQNDISDSIDGLQAILRENEALRLRLNSFNDTLDVMQNEVAKGKEIKLQMDDMIKLQQALLAKAEAREQQLLLEQQQAALAEQDITSSLWFKIVMGTMPALLILALLGFLFKRRQQASDEAFFSELDSKKKTPSPKAKKETVVEEELSLDNELSLDDELNLDDELDLSDDLSLDDELSIDLIDNDSDAIHLDEDDSLDDLDDLEDILLDDGSDDDILEGGTLAQDDLDSLLAGLDDESPALAKPSADDKTNEEADELAGGELNQDDLDDLLGGLDDEVPAVEEPAKEKAEAALDEVNEQEVEEKNDQAEELAGGELNQDDLDDLLGGIDKLDDEEPAKQQVTAAAKEAPIEKTAEKITEEKVAADVTDPDDIDALLASVSAQGSDAASDSVADKPVEAAAKEAPIEKTAEKITEEKVAADVTDPDDIDALLASVSAQGSDAASDSVADKPVEAAAKEAPIEKTAEKITEEKVAADVTDPDDIDALLASVSAQGSDAASDSVAEQPVEAAAKEAPIEKAVEKITEEKVAADVTDPDDIDALLASVAAQGSDAASDSVADQPVEAAAKEAPIEKTAEATADVTDPDDIDALLASVAAQGSDAASESVADQTVEAAAKEAPIEKAAEKITEEKVAVDVTDPDDIDALLASVAAQGSDAASDSVADQPVEAAAKEAPIEKTAEATADVTDPDDIDALLASVAAQGSDAASESVADQTVEAAAKEAPIEKAAEKITEEKVAVDVTDPDDIDALLASVAAQGSDAASDSVADQPVKAAAKEAPIEKVAEKITEATADVTDPDDIDALLASVSAQGSDAVDDSVSEDVADQSAELTDPDDIDALIASMSDHAPTPSISAKTAVPDETSAMAMDEQGTKENDSGLSAEELQIQKEIAENEAKIAEFTAEYVTPFLTADFSDILAKKNDAELTDETVASSESAAVDDELDIDALIADTQSENEVGQNEQQGTQEDIGDSLTDYMSNETANGQSDESFTESALSQLLVEEGLDKTAEQSGQPTEISPLNAIDLAPDFSDEEVLADLLAETTDADEEAHSEQTADLDIITELDNVDFDELLANIEEESATASTAVDVVELTLNDIDDDLIDDSLGKSIESIKEAEATEDYVSVDELLSESLANTDASEPYEKTNIEGVLGRFSDNNSGIDVDKDGSMSSKLDLAKMYIEMSDEENAEVILQEVIKKGNKTQQVAAQTLLDTL
ncbi:FimV/HubP family polar landmark protein [Colwellia marinimaniae]|uniref:Motility protein FimV n=1 Tax=Colwellia marinimaniae TaxID=1513592 RepID=A0ABQ0MW01_9GAMM|nr:FimV/HubP family polar landmark protein [Colwellia marinimaniae]GAW96540.1 motility protein FimV [Colwellia marinimaniae]